MEVEDPIAADPKRINFPLQIGYWVSGAWLLFFAVYYFRNSTHVNDLTANNLGDVLAGVFAPLAFLWLFVATLLQRQELELQRLELRETREVMRLQKEELRKAAEETHTQTQIMSENLKSDGVKQVYNEADILIYSLALYIAANWSNSSVQGPNVRYGFCYIFNVEKIDSAINRDNSDRVYLLAAHSLDEFISSNTGAVNITPQCGAFIDYVREQVSVLCVEEKFTRNPLVKARIASLGLPNVLANLRAIKPA